MNRPYPDDFFTWPQERRDEYFAAAARAYDEKNRWKPIVRASRFVWIDPAVIPRRQWLYGRHYVRKFISETIAPGAYGKSTLAMTEALAIATGRALLDITPDERVNVWIWNGEDPMEELQRRIISAAMYYEIDPTEIEGRLFVDTGRETKIDCRTDEDRRSGRPTDR